MWWNPFGGLASTAASIVTQGWIAACLSLWQAGLWMLQLMLWVMDKLLTIDVSADGPGHDVYGVTLWIALTLITVIAAVQIGVAAIRRDGKGLVRAGAGVGGFVLATVSWYGYAALLVTSTAFLTNYLASSLLSVTSWAKWEPFAPFDVKQITDGWLAAVLAFMGLMLWAAAIGHGAVLLARDASLLVLIAVGPITAAGLPSDGQMRTWFWKSVRWLHAAAFMPPLMVLVMGIGVKFASGVAVGMSSGVLDSMGTAVISVLLICVAVVSPLALFKLLAFVDPGTSSGAAARAGLSALGGIGGLLSGGGQSGGDSAATKTSSDGTSQGEASADSSTASRISSLGGPLGAIGAGLGVLTKVGAMGASTMTDVTNQGGVGHNTYQPDYLSGDGSGSQGGSSSQSSQAEGSDSSAAGGGDPATAAGGSPATNTLAAPAPGAAPANANAGAGASGGSGALSGSSGGGAAAGGGTGAVEAAALIV